jgi:hypothetical protein
MMALASAPTSIGASAVASAAACPVSTIFAQSERRHQKRPWLAT